VSTKSTIAHGEGFHIYNDVTDDSPFPVHIEIDEVRYAVVGYRVTPEGRACIEVTLKIDAAMWQRIENAPRYGYSARERLLAEFKTKWSLAEQRAFIEQLWLNHAYFHGIEGESVMVPLESGDIAVRVSAAWAEGKAIRDKEEGP
jgi:hypothetical protein